MPDTGVSHNSSCLLQVDTSAPQANHEAETAASACAELFLQLSEMLDRCQQAAEELTAAGDLLGQARASISAEQADEDSSAGQVGCNQLMKETYGAWSCLPQGTNLVLASLQECLCHHQ